MYFCVFISLTLREVKLSVVSYLTNSIVDQILQELYATHKTLVLQSNFSLHWSVDSEHVHTNRSASRICSSSQLRQVSQMRRLEDGGTARRAHRHADILDVVEDDFGISIVSVLLESLVADSSVRLVVFTVSVISGNSAASSSAQFAMFSLTSVALHPGHNRH